MECMKAIKAISVTAPVQAGDVVLANICGTGVDIVATKAL
jgi:CxxC motif-containing protein